MRGSPKRQAKSLVAMLKHYGNSKHRAKAEARKDMEAGKKISHSLGIYSRNTAQNYQAVYTRFLSYMRDQHDVKDASLTTCDNVREWLMMNVERNIAYDSLQAYAAALEKMPLALESIGIEHDAEWSRVIQECRDAGRKKLSREHKSRAFRCPHRVVKQMSGDFRIAADLQLRCGCRISEISELRIGRNITADVNKITLTNTKGGLIRTVDVPVDLYKKLIEAVNINGEFRIDRRAYAAELKRAAKLTGEKWSGSHSLRWNYARNKMFELEMKKGFSFDDACYITSRTLGHQRPDVTQWYLQ